MLIFPLLNYIAIARKNQDHPIIFLVATGKSELSNFRFQLTIYCLHIIDDDDENHFSVP